MCGRFGLFDGIDDLAWHFNVSPHELTGYAPRWNIAPTMPILTVGKENAVDVVRWGISASRGSRPLFNARGETVHRLPAFHSAFQQGRCRSEMWLLRHDCDAPALCGCRPFTH